jgi:hypothetical protein
MTLLCAAFLAGCTKKEKIPTYPKSRVVSIPVQSWDPDASQAVQQQNVGALNVTTYADEDTVIDELPQGPSGFDVLEDGGFVITDPLRERLVFYDSLGNYRTTWPLGFASDNVKRLSGEQFEISRASTGTQYLVTQEGQALRLSQALHPTGTKREAEAIRLGDQHGVIIKSRAQGFASDSLDIHFDREDRYLASLRFVGEDNEGFTYVALEAQRKGSKSFDVITIIRKYDKNHTLVGKITDISFKDCYIFPERAFLVKDGIVYQMVPKKDKIEIHVWNTN